MSDASNNGSDAVTARTEAEGALIITYRSLRMGIVLAVGMIFVAVIRESVRAGYIRGSISSYFYSPVRSIFVGALMVIGFSLIVIHTKHRWEETCLTLGGMLAIIVGLVPTTVPGCEAGELSGGAILCRASDSDPELPGFVKTGVWNNLLALVLIGLIGIALTYRFGPKVKKGENPSRLKILLIGYTVMLVVGGILYGTWDLFAEHTHMIAAILTFVFVGATAAFNGSETHRPNNPEKYRRIYALVAWGMVGVAVLGGLAIWAGLPDGLFWLETFELLIFAGYWVAQTFQHWDSAET